MTYTIPFKTNTDCYLLEVGGSIEPCHYCGGCVTERVDHLNCEQEARNQFVSLDIIPVYSWDMQGDEYCENCLGQLG